MEIIETSESIDFNEFMTRPLFAHLSTMSDQGPVDSPVWCMWEDDCIWINTDIVNDSFGKRLTSDNRCAIGIIDYDNNTGKLHHVGFRGKAEVVNFDAMIGARIFTKYLGSAQDTWPPWFQQFLNDQNARLVKFTPKTVVIRDLSY